MISTQNQKETILKAPELTPENLTSVVTKVQPYRKGGIRLDHEEVKGKHIFHNYGHGSSGISLAFGSSFMSVKSLYTFVNVDRPVDCAVVGSGLIALLTANELAKLGHFVTIYADKFAKYGQSQVNKKLASQVDQGLWLPFGYDLTDKLRHQLLSKISYDYYRQCLKTSRYQSFKVTTVYERDQTIKQLKQKIPSFLYNGYKTQQLNFGNNFSQPYIRLRTIKVDTELFMEELRVQATLRGIKFVQKKFNTQDDVLSLKEDCLFNCTGYSSKYLFNDTNMTGTTDYLVLFKNPSKLEYSLSAQLKEDVHMRIHCFGDKVILRSQTPAGKSGEEFVKNLIKETQAFFQNRTLKAKL